mmetsp:Transcript_49770/g.63767  ORF Transcript_49770/g.63767 Transcript_49770/m.63767 type:complete len:403 (-) Transcript_49770:181-1389(-)
MNKIRTSCAHSELVTLFHYTQPSVVRYLIQGGLRMSTQGQGDGGVYFSTMSPSSYGLGTKDYEENLITDCFGAERLHEYVGCGRLSAVVVAGCHPSVLQGAPGGRDRAKIVSKSDFLAFSLPHLDGNFFLRPDRILGVFLIDPQNPPRVGSKGVAELMLEKECAFDSDTIMKIREATQNQNNNFIDVMERSAQFLLHDNQGKQTLMFDEDGEDDENGDNSNHHQSERQSLEIDEINQFYSFHDHRQSDKNITPQTLNSTEGMKQTDNNFEYNMTTSKQRTSLLKSASSFALLSTKQTHLDQPSRDEDKTQRFRSSTGNVSMSSQMKNRKNMSHTLHQSKQDSFLENARAARNRGMSLQSIPPPQWPKHKHSPSAVTETPPLSKAPTPTISGNTVKNDGSTLI